MKLHSRMYGWKHVWMEFADEFEASVDDPSPDSSHSPMSLTLSLPDSNWVLIYRMHGAGSSANTFTTVEVDYQPGADFKFAIHPQSWLDGFGKLFGMQDVIIGEEDFDKHFVVKTNNEELVKQLFSDAHLRRHLLDEPTAQLWAHCHNAEHGPSPRVLSAGHNRASMRVKGVVDDFERLKLFYRLKHRLLENFVRIGAARG